MEGAVETSTRAAAPVKRGATWRRVERDWLDCAAYKSLSASAQAVYIHLTVVCHPKFGLGLSSRELATRCGRDERTTRRLVQVLEEAGLLRVERTRGGAHKATNRYYAIPADKAEGHAPGLARLARRAAAQRPASSTSSTPNDAPVVASPAIASVDQAPPALSAAVLEQLAEQLAGDRHLEVHQARQELGCYGAGTLAQLAAYYGLDATPAAAVVLPADPEELAREIVHDYLRAWDIARAPLRRELELARQVVAQKGGGAWDAYRNAQRRLAALVSKWKRSATRPYTFLYLLPHLAAEQALPPPGTDEPPN